MVTKVYPADTAETVAFPKELLDALQIGAGDDIVVEIEAGRRRLVVRPKDAQALDEGAVDEEFVRQVAQFIDEYRPALEELAK